VDEAGAYSDHEVIDALRSNMRAPKGVAVRMVLAMNPNGAGHLACLKRFIRRLVPFKIMALEGFSDAIVRLPSTFRDNEALNREQYQRALEQSSANDPGRLAAWRDGDWESGMSTLFFSAQWDEDRNVIPSFVSFPPGARPFLSIDWGSAKPAYCGLFASFPRGLALGGLYLPPKSVVLLDECHTSIGEALNVGSGATVEEFSIDVQKLWGDWDLPGRPHGVCDDAMTFKPGGRNSPSMADQFRAAGVDLRAAAKGRRDWSQMKSMLANAGRSQTEPGLFFCPQAQYALATIPFLSRDQRRADDLNSTSTPDHAADAIRYALLGAGFRRESATRRIGTYYADPNAWAKKLDAEIAFDIESKRQIAAKAGKGRQVA